MNNSIHIKNASFVYKNEVSKKEVIERRVLHIGNLEIKQGEITFIIGRSGSGKSTLLETIGLMNDTFPTEVPKSMTIDFHFDKHKKDILRPRIWSDNDDIIAKLNQIRLDNFSFIFQNTNLLSNFTAIDNVCITDMLNGRSYSEAYLKSLIIFSLLGLGDLDIDIYPQNISGGQRQRVAFARAIIPDYQFLFGDEPTGNLDRETSIEVLQLLSDFIRGTNSQTSTIIVSHDIDLALRFADRIIVITKDEIGEINPQNIFYREQESRASEDARRAYQFKNKIIEAFKEDSKLIEGIKSLLENAKTLLNEEPKVKSRGFIKIDELLGKVLELMKDPSKRVEAIKSMTFFDEPFYEELGHILSPKSEESVASIEKDSLVEELKNWKVVNTPDGDSLGKKELKRKISKLLKFQKSTVKIDEDDKEHGMEVKPARRSLIFIFFTLFCKIQRNFYKVNIKNLSNPLADVNNPYFTNLFIKNEGGILLGAGEKLSHFRTLFFALFVTFLGIGFATGSLSYLKEKMDDPFVNFVTTAVPSEKQTEVASIIEYYNKDTVLLSKYNINVLTGFTIFPLEMYNKKSEDLSLITGRTITLNDPLLKELFKEEKNILAGNLTGLFNEYDCGFIVSENLLIKLGLTPEARFIKVKILTTNAGTVDTTGSQEISFADAADNYELVPIPIRAVLKKIPGDLNQDIDFLITDYLHMNLLDNHEPSREYPYHPGHTKSLLMYYNTSDSAEIKTIRDTIKHIIRSNPKIMQGFKTRNLNLLNFEEYRENVPFLVQEIPVIQENQEQTEESAAVPDTSVIVESKDYAHPGYQIQVGFMGRKPDYAQIKMMYDSISSKLSALNFDVNKLEIVSLPNKRPVELKNTYPRLDRMIIHFKKLDKVEEFSKFLETTKYKYLRLDMAKIMSMKNYNYVANLTTGIIIFLIALSVYFISYFVANVIANHLDRIRMNIGTLMAFGTSGLKYIYMNLITSYMLLSILTAFIAVWIAGSLYVCRGILWLIYFVRKWFKTDFSLEPGSYFDIFNWWTLTAIVLIFLLSSLLSWIKIKQVLQETPGNLIFGRES
jgi:ABC-type lipoprotein export system ATPase subunit